MMFNRKLKNQVAQLQDEVTHLKDTSSGVGGFPAGGGYYNEITGAGTSIDKSTGSTYLPTRLMFRSEMETIYVQSWAREVY